MSQEKEPAAMCCRRLERPGHKADGSVLQGKGLITAHARSDHKALSKGFLGTREQRPE